MYSNYLVPVSLVEGRTGTSSRRSLSLSREGAPHDPKIQYERAMLTLTGLVVLAASAGGIGWFSPLSWDDLFGVQAFGLLRVVSPTQVLPPLPLPPLQCLPDRDTVRDTSSGTLHPGRHKSCNT